MTEQRNYLFQPKAVYKVTSIIEPLTGLALETVVADLYVGPAELQELLSNFWIAHGTQKEKHYLVLIQNCALRMDVLYGRTGPNPSLICWNVCRKNLLGNAVAGGGEPLILRPWLYPPHANGFPVLPMNHPNRYLQPLIGPLACLGFVVKPGVKTTA